MPEDLWQRYRKYLYASEPLGLSLDISRMRFGDDFLPGLADALRRAHEAMTALEAGAIANPDENRMVGHYWLRSPERAPDPKIAAEIRRVVAEIKDFAAGVHRGDVRGAGGPFENLLLIGIGGSALGPQFVAHALGSPSDPLQPYFFDNTDPEGMDRTLTRIGPALDRTLFIVTSKSGGTPETRNGMLEAMAACRRAGIAFPPQAVAVTQEGSQLDTLAVQEGWRARFPMWDWIGGRTSVLSAVGLLPAALEGFDIDEFLAGARAMDEATREPDLKKNPAMLLAAMWFHAGDGQGKKDMVILPYKDRLELFSRYLQQLVMESLGKEKDRKGRVVHQGIAVYGNKGSTDQHAYVQQLRDGVPNFFVTFLKVLRDRAAESIEVEPGITSGDYLTGLLEGTRRALYENGRDSITITIDEATPRRIGELIALYERAVGIYGELVDVNAYHQPGVEAGKKAARGVLDLQLKVVQALAAAEGDRSAEELAAAAGRPDEVEIVAKILTHLAANPGRGVSVAMPGPPWKQLYRSEASGG